MSETSVKIKVQHDSGIHQGACVQNCPNQQSKVYNSKIIMCVPIELTFIILQSCPKLQVTLKGSKKEVKGAEAIYNYLTELNAKIRQVARSDSYSYCNI
jgi:hypothetical protein